MEGTTPKTGPIYGIAPIENRCGVLACGEPASAAVGTVFHDDTYVVDWWCENHADDTVRELRADRPPDVAMLTVDLVGARVCDLDVGGKPCGAMATCVVLMGYWENGRPLGSGYVCDRHAEEMESR